jgi:hypothetical protein
VKIFSRGDIGLIIQGDGSMGWLWISDQRASRPLAYSFLAFVAAHFPAMRTDRWPHVMRTPASKVPSALTEDTNLPSVPKAEKAFFSILLA